MRRSTFALALVLFSILTILAVAYYMSLDQDVSSGAPAGQTVMPHIQMAAAVPQPILILTPDLTMPDTSSIMSDFPRIFDNRINAVLPTIRPTSTPTPAQPCPTPMKPMDPWKPMAAMTPMLH